MIDNDIIRDLAQYADLENTEIGEACTALINCYQFRDTYEPEFVRELENQIKDNLEYFRKYSEIVERKIVTERNVLELEWYEDELR